MKAGTGKNIDFYRGRGGEGGGGYTLPLYL